MTRRVRTKDKTGEGKGSSQKTTDGAGDGSSGNKEGDGAGGPQGGDGAGGSQTNEGDGGGSWQDQQ